jgi:hypothetical protein
VEFHLKFILKKVSKSKFFPLSENNIYLFSLTKLLLENAIITKTTFLGANCVAGLEIGGKMFRKIKFMTPSPGPSRGVPLAHKNNMGLSTSRT